MDKTLVILAAGMGSRFGGLKQVSPMGPNGEFIIDYSIFDALRAGFNKVVFIIRKNNFSLFRDTIGKRIEKKIDVEYVFQENDNIDDVYSNLKNREKPLGTAHALLCCKNVVKEPFLLINADDFYGKDSFVQAARFLDNTYNKKNIEYAIILYKVKNTIPEVGAVKRGVCEIAGDKLILLTESFVEKLAGKIYYTPLNGGIRNVLEDNNLVSMNMLALNPSIFEYIEKEFEKFLTLNNDNDYLKVEFLIPEVLFKSQVDNYSVIKPIKTKSKWYGVTYKEDIDTVKENINILVQKGEYPNNLWD